MTDPESWARPPATVYLPTSGEQNGSDEHQVVVRQVAETELVITAYTGLHQLVQCCGPRQPWVELDWDVVEDLRQQLDAVVVLDLPSYDTLEDFAEAAGRRLGTDRKSTPKPP